jgi:hypothetical protein
LIDVKFVYVTPELFTNILSVKNSKGSELLNLLYQNGHLIGDEGKAVIHTGSRGWVSRHRGQSTFCDVVDPYRSSFKFVLFHLRLQQFVKKKILKIFLFLQRVLLGNNDSLPNTPTLNFFVKEIEKERADLTSKK